MSAQMNETPARESVDVERLARELFRAWCGPNAHLDSAHLDNTPSLIDCWQRIARRAISLLAPPRDSSPAASGDSNVRVEEIPGGLAIKTTRSPVQWSKEPRCEVCDWPLAPSTGSGCRPGDCRYRPTQGSDEWYRINARRAELAARDSSAAESGRAGAVPISEAEQVIRAARRLRFSAKAVCDDYGTPSWHGSFALLSMEIESFDTALMAHDIIEKSAIIERERASKAPPTPDAPEAKPSEFTEPWTFSDRARDAAMSLRATAFVMHAAIKSGQPVAPEIVASIPEQIEELDEALNLHGASAPISTDEGELERMERGMFEALERGGWSHGPLDDNNKARLRVVAKYALSHRRAPAPEAERETQPRVETGVVQFDDDWPGVFLRGDYAGPIALTIEHAASHLDVDNPDRYKLESFAHTLASCDTHKGGREKARKITLTDSAARLRDLLRTVEELHGKATPAPWVSEACGAESLGIVKMSDGDIVCSREDGEWVQLTRADADLIAELRSLVPALLALARGEVKS